MQQHESELQIATHIRNAFTQDLSKITAVLGSELGRTRELAGELGGIESMALDRVSKPRAAKLKSLVKDRKFFKAR